MPAQNPVAVTGFTLINADTQQPVNGFDPLINGTTLDLTTLPTSNLNLRANTTPAVVGSVRFVLPLMTNIDNVAPYALLGDKAGVYTKFVPPLGQLTLSATPYAGANRSGQAGATVTLSFNIVKTLPLQVSKTVTPVESSDVLYNPGMGFADFQFGWGAPLPPVAQYPTPRVAYFRWTWAELEPTSGQINFKTIDDVIAKAATRNERLAFRIMPGIPAWVAAQGVPQLGSGTGTVPDHNNAQFLSYHERFVQALGLRFGTSSSIDHVDIGSVGCWGEWNTSCCPAGQSATCQAYMPTETNRRNIVNWYDRYFPNTPLVALAEATGYPNTIGAGWRGDCFGDYGFFGSTWNHMVNWYPSIVQNPLVANAWQTAPVQFESCNTMQDWYNKGFNIDTILQRGLDWHMSVFNGKNSAVPAAWKTKVEEWMKKIGYRFVLTRLTHPSDVTRGGPLALAATWTNKGVAPVYHAWPLAYRLRAADGTIAAQWRSSANLRTWLPGTYSVPDTVVVPGTIAAGSYSLDVAILDEGGQTAFVQIAIAGKRTDLWYPVSTINVK